MLSQMAHVTVWSALSVLVNRPPIENHLPESSLCPLCLREPHSLQTLDNEDETIQLFSNLQWPIPDNLEFINTWRERFTKSRASQTRVSDTGSKRSSQLLNNKSWKFVPFDLTSIISKEDIKIAFEEGNIKYNEKLALEEKLKENDLSLDKELPSYTHQALFRRTHIKAREFSRYGFVMDHTTKAMLHRLSEKKVPPTLVTPLNLQLLGPLEICEIQRARPKPGPCDSSARYRAINGDCNNLKNPGWGSAFSSLRRVTPPDFGDGVRALRQATDGTPLPSARLISTTINSQQHSPATCFSFLHLIFGQFVDHDITSTPVTKGVNGSTLPCCIRNLKGNPELLHPECAPITIPSNDHFYSTWAVTCMEFARSVPAERCSLGPREQVNQITAFLDGSNIYGSTIEDNQKLREGKGGRLLMRVDKNGEDLLPPSLNPDDGCNSKEKFEQEEFCFISGDSRVNEQVLLTLLHTLWTREHNRVARQLEALQPTWADEKLFQEARHVVVAEMQQIVYNEFLPGVLGKTLVETLGLLPQKDGLHTSHYDPDVNPGIATEFSTAAFRYGHSMLPGRLEEVDREGKTKANELNDILFQPFTLYSRDGPEYLVRGGGSQNVLKVDPIFTNQISGKLFRKNQKFGLDLVSLNLQRGRDHAMGSYLVVREACGLPPVTTFDELEKHLQPGAHRRLQEVYRHVRDIDLFAGGVSEKAIAGGQVGPTFACLIADQFKRLKVGDRFWYEEKDGPGAFTTDQLRQLHGVSMARILCNNIRGIQTISRWPMQVSSAFNPQLPCDFDCIPSIDFTFWR